MGEYILGKMREPRYPAIRELAPGQRREVALALWFTSGQLRVKGAVVVTRPRQLYNV